MTNENGRSMPDGYYFDKNSVDAVAESEMKAKDMIVEVPTENVETTTENTETPKTELAPAEVAQKRREAVANFFKDTKENFKNKASNVGNGIKNFFGKVKAFGGKALDVAIAPDAYLAKGLETADNFLNTKAEQLNSFAEGRIDMLKMIAEFVQNKTVEKYTEVQNGVASRYEGLKQYGSDAIEAGASRIRVAKEGVRAKKNSLIIAFLKSIEEKHRSEADRVAANISLLQGLTS